MNPYSQYGGYNGGQASLGLNNSQYGMNAVMMTQPQQFQGQQQMYNMNSYNAVNNQQTGYTAPVNSQYSNNTPYYSGHNNANSNSPNQAIPLDAVLIHERLSFGPEYNQSQQRSNSRQPSQVDLTKKPVSLDATSADRITKGNDLKFSNKELPEEIDISLNTIYIIIMCGVTALVVASCAYPVWVKYHNPTNAKGILPSTLGAYQFQSQGSDYDHNQHILDVYCNIIGLSSSGATFPTDLQFSSGTFCMQYQAFRAFLCFGTILVCFAWIALIINKFTHNKTVNIIGIYYVIVAACVFYIIPIGLIANLYHNYFGVSTSGSGTDIGESFYIFIFGEATCIVAALYMRWSLKRANQM